MPIGTKVRVLTGEAAGRVGVVMDNTLRDGVPVATCVYLSRCEWVIVATERLVRIPA